MVFGGGFGVKAVEGSVIKIDLVGGFQVKPIKVKGLGRRRDHAVSVIGEDRYSQTILILGGWNEKRERDNAMIALRLELTPMFHLLHYMEATIVWWILGVNQCQDLFELMFGEHY